MCGRFTLTATPTEVSEHFGLAEVPELSPRFNVAPGQDVATISRSADEARPALHWRRWGLVPSWAKEAKIGNRLINARSETVSEKPAFRSALRRRRCLVPSNGFYEWAGARGSKQPYFVALEDRGLFAFAGLWEHWKDPDGETLESCTLLTAAAHERLSALHGRMPVILRPESYARWLDPELEDPAQVEKAIDQNLGGSLHFHAVSRHVNDVRRDDPRCIEVLAEPDGLF